MQEEALLQEFIAEAEDHLDRLEPQLLHLEQDPENTALVQEIFVATHAIKGTAAYVGFSHISDFTHLIESVLDRLRQQTLRASADIIDGLLQSLDSLRQLINQAASGESGPDVSESRQWLQQWTSPSDDQPQKAPTAPLPRSEPLMPEDLDAGELRALDPEDADVFADIATQQLAVIRLGSEQLQALVRERAEPAGADVSAATQSIATAFRRIQSAAALLEAPSLHAAVARDAAVFQAESLLNDADDNRVPQALDSLAHLLTAFAALRQPPPAAAPPPSETSGPGTTSQRLRVEVDRIDALVNLASELVANRARLVRIEQVLDALYDDARTGADRLIAPTAASRKAAVHLFKALRERMHEGSADAGRLASQLQEAAMRARMIPIGQVVNRFPRMVRDLCRHSGKRITLDISGADTELDKSVMDWLADPLIHLLRNAVDHGIETPEEREAIGKDAQGRIRLSAAQHGNQILIRLEDDGRGIDAAEIRRKAVLCQIITQDEAQAMPDTEALKLIFRTGFSTREHASSLSGRGVGLHLVKQNLEQVNGRLTVDTVPGAGSTFVLTFPLTLAVIPALSVAIQANVYAIPLSAVEEAVRIADHEIALHDGRRLISWQEAQLPLLRFADLLGEPPQPDRAPSSWNLFDEVGIPLPEAESMFPEPFFDREEPITSAVIIRAGDQAMGVVVDRFLGESDMVITAIDHDLMAIEGLAGASILPDGRIAFVLDAAALLRLAGRKGLVS